MLLDQSVTFSLHNNVTSVNKCASFHLQVDEKPYLYFCLFELS